MTPARALLLRALPALALHALAREVDACVGTLLYTTLDLPGFVGHALGLLDVRAASARVLVFVAAGFALLGALAFLRMRRGEAFPDALAGEAASLQPLYLRPFLTLLALASLLVRPSFPYGFTLPVALTQDWAIAQDAAALVALVAYRVAPIRVGAPRAGEVFFACFLAYALLVPEWARVADGHPGNEPKYLRMAVALGHRVSLDVEGIEGPVEEPETAPLLPAARTALAELWQESSLMLHGLATGRLGLFDKGAVEATRVARQTIRGKQGGIFHVLAPGPSLLLAPTLRIDRALNRLRGTPGRLAVSLLLWNALGAALIAALFLLIRDATGRPGLAAALAGLFALLPPFVFYFFQFYPEMPGALLLTLALRLLLFERLWTARRAAALGGMLAALPWLHQKFLPVALFLSLMALLRAVDQLVTFRALLALLAPQALSLYLTALYNFAIAGSPRPDALFLAWGPAGITSAHFGQGFIGLLIDARYGILPYVPLLLAGLGGILMRERGARLLRLGAPAALVYYMTVAAADDWHGAVSNLGRYFMPVAPYVIAAAGVAVANTLAQRGAATVLALLAALSALHARALWSDPHAANEATRLLARSRFADGSVYIPDLFIRSFAEGAPGLFARIAAWALLALLLALWLRRAAAGRAGFSPATALFGATSIVLAGALALERWPPAYRLARFQNAFELRPGTTAFVAAGAETERGVARARAGRVDLLVRSRASVDEIAVHASGKGRLRVPGRPPLEVAASGTWASLPLAAIGRFEGRRGVSESFYRQRFQVEGEDADVKLRFAAVARP
jgi:hypothetical protein